MLREINILRDEPSDTDAFKKSGEAYGPHEQVAASIEERIRSNDGGGAIGLEGDYGSGKSTVVRILQEELDGDPDITMVLFDASYSQ